MKERSLILTGESVNAILAGRIDESNGLDWKDENQGKWGWGYNYGEASLKANWCSTYQSSDSPVFRIEVDPQQVIDACKNDILVTMGVK